MENSLEKGKSMPIGTITNGFKKIAEGKWRKVSESHGMTKEEHEKKAQEHRTNMETSNKDNKGHIYHREMSFRDTHKELASKLDSKEYSDVDVVGKEKEEEFVQHGDSLIMTHGKDKFIIYPFGNQFILQINGENKMKGTLSTMKGATKDFIKNKDIDKSTINDIEKALVTLEIGYLARQVSEEQIKEARKTTKNG